MKRIKTSREEKLKALYKPSLGTKKEYEPQASLISKMGILFHLKDEKGKAEKLLGATNLSGYLGHTILSRALIETKSAMFKMFISRSTTLCFTKFF
jgi:hypothetical protein